jgi:hypothetical protein
MTSLPARARDQVNIEDIPCPVCAAPHDQAEIEGDVLCKNCATRIPIFWWRKNPLLAAHSELERVREALTAINRRLSNGGLTFDELIREAAYSASIARAALSPQPPKEERVTPSELEAAHRQGYIAGQVEEAARRSPAIRREALEEAARVAERIWDEGQQGAHGGEQAIRTAAAIRSLMDVG